MRVAAFCGDAKNPECQPNRNLRGPDFDPSSSAFLVDFHGVTRHLQEGALTACGSGVSLTRPHAVYQIRV